MKASDPSPPRLHALDSLRGLAALVVLFTHCYLVLPASTADQLNWLRFSPLRILINGHASVILFFVLSGYVLAHAFPQSENGLKWKEYGLFCVKRVCRIYLPFIAILSLAALLYLTLNSQLPKDTGSLWLDELWPASTTLPDLLRQTTLSGHPKDMWLDSVMWSLVHEMRISIIFPLLILLCRSSFHPLLLSILLFVSTSIALSTSGLADETFTRSNDTGTTFLLTARFIPFFILGIMLNKKSEALHHFFSKISSTNTFLIWLFVLGAFGLPLTIHSLPLEIAGIKTDVFRHFLPHISDAFAGVASALAIILAQKGSRSGVLFTWSLPRWLGKISYSLYLIHLPVIIILFRTLIGHMPLLILCMIVVLLSLCLAQLSNILIERPAMRLGYALVTKLSTRDKTSSTP